MSNLTKSYIERRPNASSSQQKFEWDDAIKGFGIRITAGSKTFIVDRKLNGKTIRLTIGRFPAWSPQDARQRARELVVMMDKGIDPRLEARKQAEQGVTLATVFEQFLIERPLKERTKSDYQRYLNYYFSAWKDRSISRIDSEMVIRRYRELLASSCGSAQASSAMRFLRSVLNYAQATYGANVLPFNPVASLTAKRAWIRDKARTDHLRVHEIKPFVLALRKLPNPVMGAYLEFILLTGSRRREASSLKWKDIDFKGRVLTFQETKNHTNRVIPMTPRMAALVELMKNWKIGEYVFPSIDKAGKPTHLVDPRKALRTANSAASSSVTVHGLRRTYATILESLDCPAYPLKTFLGHSVRGDVTASHYTQIGVERLRSWAEKYENHFAKIVGDAPDAEIFTLDSLPKSANA